MTAGTYGGGTFGWPLGGGLGLYFDNRGRVYPQLYAGTPRLSLSAGYSPDLEGLLTGPSLSGSAGIGTVRFNAAGSGGASGFGVGTPGVGVTHGYGPYELSNDFSRPWAKPYIRDSIVSAGIPSRSNVFEYGFPESDPVRPPLMELNTTRGMGSVGSAVASPVPFAVPQGLSGGIPGLLFESGLNDPMNPNAPPPGGLLGLIQEYLSEESRGSRERQD